jgi:hypothetical protein
MYVIGFDIVTTSHVGVEISLTTVQLGDVTVVIFYQIAIIKC